MKLVSFLFLFKKMRQECFEIVDHTADVGIKAMSNSIEGLFYNLFLGWREFSFSLNGNTITTISEKLQLQASDLEQLLVSFLSEINYLLCVKGHCCTDIKDLNIEKGKTGIKLECLLCFIQYDSAKVLLKHEIKAVTFSDLFILYEKGIYSTTIILDI